MPGPGNQPWNALIRTHHITSRKKVAKLRQAAGKNEVYALICCGDGPGIMYTEGSADGVRRWVGSVNRLRYKDYQLAIRPSPVASEIAKSMKPPEMLSGRGAPAGLFEVHSAKEFGAVMQQRGIWSWWRRGMGYAPVND